MTTEQMKRMKKWSELYYAKATVATQEIEDINSELASNGIRIKVWVDKGVIHKASGDKYFFGFGKVDKKWGLVVKKARYGKAEQITMAKVSVRLMGRDAIPAVLSAIETALKEEGSDE